MKCFALHSSAVYLIDTSVVIARLLAEKSLQLICGLAAPFAKLSILRKPLIVERDICNSPVSVAIVPVMPSAKVLSVRVRLTVIVAVLR